MEKMVCAVVVMYNTYCQESPTCMALKKTEKIRVIIYDNSTRDMGNREYCESLNWVYLGGDGNKGISKAYNACIDYIKEKGIKGIICLFDDDTAVEPAYFESLYKARAKGEKILVPLIYSANKLISPCVLKKGHRVIPFESKWAVLNYKGNEISAINSCMAIDTSVFDNYRYDENIFLDGVDHYFISQMHQRGIEIGVMDYCCNHAFSGTEHPPKQAALTRFKIYAKDYKYILRNEKLSYIKLVGKRALSLCVKYKTLEFLFTR